MAEVDPKAVQDKANEAREEQVESSQGAEVLESEAAENETSPEVSSGEAAAEETPEDLVAKAQAETKEWQDKYLRLHAEWDTYRRRMKQQREEERARATEALVEGLIPVLDDFERSIDFANKNGETGLLGGITAIQTKLNEVLAKDGVEVINPVGEAYDALAAQAVSTVDDPTVPDETVAEVFQKGYRMGNKVLRPAMVTVAVGGPKREVEADEQE